VSSGKADSSVKRLETATERGEYVFRLYFTADYAIARAEILDYIRLLDRFASQSNDTVRNCHYDNGMLWYVRLAKLEEQNGGANAAEYMREATTRCARLPWPDCSEDELRRQVDRMDGIAKRHLL